MSLNPPTMPRSPRESGVDAVPMTALDRLIRETDRVCAGDPEAADHVREMCRDTTLPHPVRALAAAIGRLAHAGMARDRESVRMREELRAAMNDPLTGLPNRARFEETLCEAMTESETGGGLMALAFIDLDRVKPVNDAHGHAAGDALLREAALRIRASIRAKDFAARIGGDEFGVILRDIPDRPVAEAVSDRIIAALGRPIRVENREVQIGASVGLAFHPLDGCSAHELLQRADRALYRAKAAGGNRTECWR